MAETSAALILPTERPKKLGEIVGGIIQNASQLLKNVEIGFALATKGVWVEKSYDAKPPELGSSFETFFDLGKFSEIYNKFPTGEGGRMYGFGEVNYSQPMPAEKLQESPIQTYWDIISADPDSTNYRSASSTKVFLEEMKDRNITPEQLGKMIAKELPTRVAESFRDACKLQVQLEKALISDASAETVQDIIKSRNQKARLAFLMNGHYEGSGTERFGWAGKGNVAYKKDMNELVTQLATKLQEVQKQPNSTESVAKLQAKIAELKKKSIQPVHWPDLYHYEGYQGSGKMYAIALEHKTGTTLSRRPFAKEQKEEDLIKIPAFEAFSKENRLI